MDVWDNFYCILGKVFLSLIIGVVVFFLLCRLDKWMNKSEAKEIQPKVYPMYDSKGRLIERKLVERR